MSLLEPSSSDSSSTDQGKTPKKRSWLRQIVGIVISIVCLWLIFRQIELEKLLKALYRLQWQYVGLAIASLAFGYAVRIQRWSIMLRVGGAQVSGLACAAPFLGSITLNNVLPFRAGDVVRALVFPAAIGVRRVTATASLLLERLIDLLTLLISLGIGLSLSPPMSLPNWLGESVAVLSLFGGVTLLFMVAFNTFVAGILTRIQHSAQHHRWVRIGKSLELVKDLIHDLGGMSRPKALFLLFLLSALVWIGEAGLFWALLEGLGLSGGIASALMIMAVSTLSTLVPSSPGYVGTFHLAAFSAATFLGGSSTQAASFAVLAHFALWLPTTLAGAIAILASPSLFKGRKVASEPAA
ncbi:lysylphosphatidylglycerol synthase transmembrane domain-containing protein [Methylocaldum sp. GT1BB]|jgi:uncharacterized protein (TIRG00374 family)|uniref:lysylphosphatidylglycerol synthase transmembrane domain-containing protein n=1 Tax=Methylocaldum sp. GT1BB TaxID=3438963 RepID=UPI003DA0EAA7